MRKYQITIDMHIVDENTKPTDARNLIVYADGNDILGTISAGFTELVEALVHSGKMLPLPYVVRQHRWK